MFRGSNIWRTKRRLEVHWLDRWGFPYVVLQDAMERSIIGVFDGGFCNIPGLVLC